MSVENADVEQDRDQDFVDVDSDDDKSNGFDLFDVVIANPTPADKRAHHNALERKRRDHIKESFSSLRDCVPNLTSEKASRAQILKKATEYIASMKNKNGKSQQDIDSMRIQNKRLEDEIAALEKIKHTHMFTLKTQTAAAKPVSVLKPKESTPLIKSNDGEELSDSNEVSATENSHSPESRTRRKKLKT